MCADAAYDVYLREENAEAFEKAASVIGCEVTLAGLKEYQDYEFFVQRGDDEEGMHAYVDELLGSNPAWTNLTAVKEGRVYSQISFRSNAANLETALADAYYAACVIYPEAFKDVDPVAKAGEIFEKLLGTNPYADLKEAGYEFRPIQIGA